MERSNRFDSDSSMCDSVLDQIEDKRVKFLKQMKKKKSLFYA